MVTEFNITHHKCDVLPSEISAKYVTNKTTLPDIVVEINDSCVCYRFHASNDRYGFICVDDDEKPFIFFMPKNCFVNTVKDPINNDGDGYLFETETKPYYNGFEQYDFLLKG